jgi:hypothetical protein
MPDLNPIIAIPPTHASRQPLVSTPAAHLWNPNASPWLKECGLRIALLLHPSYSHQGPAGILATVSCSENSCHVVVVISCPVAK